MDKTVRLWHVSRAECLCCFQHIDFVTAIAFHPKDDRYFLSGSLDGKLRLWNIPDKKVALWNEVDGATKLITAANFCQNGRFAVVGTYDGRCIFYSTELLKYFTQIHVRYIVCASEDHYIYIWKAYHDYAKFSSARRDRNDYWEGIRAHSAVVTAAVFAPNPALLIQEEWRAERKSTSGLSAEAAAGAAAAGSVADPLTQELQRRPSCAHEPGYLGEALVTADFTGSIKVLVNRVKPRSTGGTVSTTLPLAPSH
ncbi:PREDICTED: WD repeat-containing protein 44-like [Priapulus caudatus]|uniref:WD repeat-containing protein 44 n=1 Tax=Priapulus caudatus TaxID=37621 RepID=A0ABM1DPV4_PRICU|nr:PREDICTED: WD repeat-containing protein 44-like [Priapulus caudatus]